MQRFIGLADLRVSLVRAEANSQPPKKSLPVIGLLTLVYFIAGKFGLMLASLHASASPVWPPAGIALAALLVLGYRAWPAIFVGAFLVNVSTAGDVATSLAVASGNTLEAVCGAWLVNRFAGGTTVFDRPQGVVKFALAAVVSAIISPAFGVTSLALAGFADWTNYGAIWLTWWLGDTTGDLLIAPLIVLWSIGSKRRWNRREAVEVGILLLLLFVLSVAVFCGWLTISARNYPIAFICGLIVIWTAFSFAQRETATGIFILSAIAIWGTMHGFGPFVGETENQSLLALQSWTATLAITAMALSAGMAERGRAEAALRESESRIDLAANAAHLGLWLWNFRDDELWVTEKWRKLFGIAESEPVTLDRLLQVVHPEDRERLKQVAQDMLEHGGDEHESEYRITLPDGNTRWIAGYGSVELDERGQPAFARGVSRDITLRKHVEEELRESEARFRTVANVAPVMIWMSGTDKLCTFFNKGWLEFTGRTVEQELGNGWAESIHADDLDHCLEVYETSFNAWQPFTMEYRLRRNDGEYRWVLDSGTPHFAPDGEFLGYIGSCIDMTEQKRSEEKFRIVLDAAPNAMIMVDSAGAISFANVPAGTVFGYSLDELIGRRIETLIPERFHDRHAGYRQGFISQPSSRAMGVGRDLFGRRKDGSEFPVEVGLSPIHTAEGLFVLASVIDITARKEAELEHQRQNLELARVGRVVVMGELAASLAHEVNNPIGAIVANASAGQRLIAAGKIETEELTELLGDIVADGRRAGEVIQGIRNMVRKGEARRELIQIGDIIHQLLRIVHADAIEREVKVTAEVDSDSSQVWGDPVQLLQVLLNLTINAFEAMTAVPSSARRLVIHTGRDGNGDILISMRDSGPGFPSGIAEELFEPFFSTKPEGTGMGLAIARSIIEAHGGTLTEENIDGGGACFTVSLPQATEDNSKPA
jgi:PAS domain S-box-containing protein